MTIGRAVVAVPAQHRRPARGRDDQDRVRSAGAFRVLHRRVGGAVAVAEPGRAARLFARPRRRHRARRQGHVPARRHPQRRRSRPRLPDRQEPRVPALEHVPRQRAQRRGGARDQSDVGRAVRRRVPRRRGPCSSTCATTRGSRSTCGPSRTSRSCATGVASTPTAGCTSSGRPDQIVPIVCGGLGSLHAIALPSFGESQMQSHPVLRP